MHIKDYLTGDTNTIELYFCPEDIEKGAPVFPIAWNYLPKLPTWTLQKRFDQEVVEYSHRDLIYQYDTATDTQKVLQRTWVQDDFDRKEYTVCFQEETLPCHRFPCTTEINDTQKYYKAQYKINNRMYLVVEKRDPSYIIYLRYQHASQVDIEKMNEDWHSIYHQVRKSIRV